MTKQIANKIYEQNFLKVIVWNCFIKGVIINFFRRAPLL